MNLEAPKPTTRELEREATRQPGREATRAVPRGSRASDRLEVDDCEIAGWSHAAIYLKGGIGHHVHHSFVHHNQYQGLGYGVCHDVAESLIERNLFDCKLI